MDTFTIRKLLKTYKCFKGVYPSDRLPFTSKLPLNIIANTDPADKPGQHWVSLSIDKRGKGYYFDSFGLPPLVPSIRRFLTLKCKNGWTYNKTQIQDVRTTVCGNYCVLFTIFKCNNLSPKQFFVQFSDKTMENDIKMKNIFRNFSLVKTLVKK